MRALLERLSRNVVLKRRLPPRNGGRPLYVSPGASLRFWRPGLERADPLLLEVARRFVRGGAMVWDVGANVGLFSIASAVQAGAGGGVLAVEADPWLADLILRSARLAENADLRLEVLQAAVGVEVGRTRFTLARRGRAASHLSVVAGSTQAGGAAAELVVPAVTLDALLDGRRPPDFVKIDVEGAELLVLEGATRLLAEVRPAIYCEVSAQCAAGVTSVLLGNGFRLYDVERDPALAHPLPRAVWNTLALP
jgi:FkbM family methyltransferase